MNTFNLSNGSVLEFPESKTIYVGEKVFAVLSEKCSNTKDYIFHRDITIIKHPHLEPTQICSFDEDIVKIMEEMGL